MKLGAPSLAVLLLLTPAAAMANPLYPVPCSFDLGSVPKTTVEYCACNGGAAELNATFANAPTSWGVQSACSGQGAACTITYRGSQTVSCKYDVPAGQCLQAGSVIECWMDDDLATLPPTCTFVYDQYQCAGGDNYTNWGYGVANAQNLVNCPG